jgi:hypothetical protein
LQGADAWQNYVPQVLETLINCVANCRVLSKQKLRFNTTPTGAENQKSQDLNVCIVSTSMLWCYYHTCSGSTQCVTSYLNVGGGNPWAGHASENLTPRTCSVVYILVRGGTLGAAAPTGSARTFNFSPLESFFLTPSCYTYRQSSLYKDSHYEISLIQTFIIKRIPTAWLPNIKLVIHNPL